MAKEKLHITEEEYVEKAVLVGLVTREQTEEQLKEYLDELEF